MGRIWQAQLVARRAYRHIWRASNEHIVNGFSDTIGLGTPCWVGHHKMNVIGPWRIGVRYNARQLRWILQDGRSVSPINFHGRSGCVIDQPIKIQCKIKQGILHTPAIPEQCAAILLSDFSVCLPQARQ